MATFVAMLRSINVGGRNRVAMADLRELVSSLGFGEVSTYLQSGNVVFTGSGSPGRVARAIEGRIDGRARPGRAVVVRSKPAADRRCSAPTPSPAGGRSEDGPRHLPGRASRPPRR